MSSIAIITARGGSKRIPNKNIKPFCGKPIIAYSIEAAINSAIFDEVMVSTDSEEIADIARKFGAAVPFMRSKENSNDHATTADVLNEVLLWYELHGIKYDTFTCIYPTAPFITAAKLIDAMRMFEENGADSLIAVERYAFPPQRGFLINDNKIRFLYPEHERTRSQDLDPIYHDCGQFYFCRSEAFLKSNTLILTNTVPFIIPEEETQDIDTISDWRIAEMKYKAMNTRRNTGYSSFYNEDELSGIGLKSYGKDVKISRNAILYNPEQLIVGDHVRIDDFATISGRVEIGDYIHIAQFCGLYGGTEGIFMADFCGISSRSVVYATSNDYSGESLTNPTVPGKYKKTDKNMPVYFEKHVVVGTTSVILPGVTIGEGSSVGALSLVTRSLDSWGVYAGSPVKRIRDRKKNLLDLEKQLRNDEK